MRSTRVRALAVVLAFAAAGCQDYNFNPVGQCLIQPGSERVSLSNVSTADVLFVVDESGSMGGEQQDLANNFDAFVSNLNQANVDRAASGLQPIDFHLAVTTSSVFWNEQTGGTCRTNCPGALGQAVCCTSANVPDREPSTCAGPGAACPTGECRLDCNGFKGEFYCCDGTTKVPARTEIVSCSPSRVGTLCGGLQTHYDMRGCTSPIATNEWPYAQGDFVSKASSGVAGAPFGKPAPRVVHFDKEVYGPTARNRQGFTQAQLIEFFKENVQVGTCGSGQEQALQGGRLALQKALSGQQRDTYDAAGGFVWTAPTATALPTTAPARWPNPNSKIVLVFVGDEDDCSSPVDPSGGVVMISGEGPSVDACSRDALQTTDASIRNKQFPVSDFVSYFTNLGRPVAAGFILPAAQQSCTLQTCTAGPTDGLCCHPDRGCSTTEGAQAPGTRLLATAQALRAAGAEVVAGSICDGSFGTILNDIAEIVKPPETLTLPSVPADAKIALLRILDANGTTRKLCDAPLPPRPAPNYTLPEAKNTGADWWFTVSDTAGPPYDPTGASTISVPSQYVYINPQGSCRANPGETYSADYLGIVPARTNPADEASGGCDTSPSDPDGSEDCRSKLGGRAGAFLCYKPLGDGARGTCTCNPNAP